MHRIILSTAISFALILPGLTQLGSAQQYRTAKLPLLAGPVQSFAVNQAGAVAGTFQEPTGYYHGFFWSKTSGFTDIGQLVTLTGFNDSGQVTGGFYASAKDSHAFLWTATGGMQDLGPSGGYSAAAGINAAGQIGGTYSLSPFGPARAFLWTASTGWQDLGLGDNSFSLSINSSGQVLAYVLDASNNSYHPVLWSPPGSVLPLDVPNSTSTGVSGLNEAGQVVGNFSSVTCQSCGFIWDGISGFQTFAANGTNTGAQRINSTGQVAGTEGGPGPNMAFFRSEFGVIQDVGTAGGFRSFPHALNNKGEIYAESCPSGAGLTCHFFLWSPTSGILNSRLPISHGYRGGTAELNDAGQIVGNLGAKQVILLSPYMHLTMTSSLNPSKAGDNVTFTATVTSLEGAPPDGEIVNFKQGSVSLATAVLIGGSASFTTPSLKVGTDLISAVYVGDVNYDTSASGMLHQVVKP